jgi:outer membrane protein assembly factor BamB
VGIGFASFVVADGKVYTTGWEDEKDTLFCFDALTGKEVWKHSYAAELGDKFYEGGTSATPSLIGGKVYHLSRWGDAMCLDAATGKPVWEKQLQKETGLKLPDWGYAGSPILFGEVLVLNMGKGGVGVEPATGKVLWKSGDDFAAGYSTPFPSKMGGKTIAVLATGKSYAGINPENGKEVWSFEWKTAYDINAADPVAVGPNLFISSGYEKGAALLKFDGSKPGAVWNTKVMRNQFNSSILHKEHLYGIDGNNGKGASLKCIHALTGAAKWEDKSVGFGSVAMAGENLIILTEKGELRVAPASPEKIEPTGSVQILKGRCWTVPVLANGIVYARNAAGDVVAVDLRK